MAFRRAVCARRQGSKDFELKVVEPPGDYSSCFEKIVLVQRLREVRALIGFSRIESPGDHDNPVDFPAEQRAPLSRKAPAWVPASQIRGEGIFFQFAESESNHWTALAARHDAGFLEAHRRWRPRAGRRRLAGHRVAGDMEEEVAENDVLAFRVGSRLSCRHSSGSRARSPIPRDRSR